MAPIRGRRNWSPFWSRRYDRRPQHFYIPRRPPQVRRFANRIRRRASDRRQRREDEAMYRSERENEQILHHDMIQEANKERRRRPIVIDDSDADTVDLRPVHNSRRILPVEDLSGNEPQEWELTEDNYDEQAVADEQALTDLL